MDKGGESEDEGARESGGGEGLEGHFHERCLTGDKHVSTTGPGRPRLTLVLRTAAAAAAAAC